jgi:hypothetical protein
MITFFFLQVLLFFSGPIEQFSGPKQIYMVAIFIQQISIFQFLFF